jgi:hypothetical protein
LFADLNSQKKDESGSESPSPNASAPPVENVTSGERMEALELNKTRDPFSKDRDRFEAEVRGLFDEGNFAKLEEIVSELVESRAKFGDGEWKISSFYYGLAALYGREEKFYIEDFKKYRDWQEAFPKSSTWRIALADLYWDYAWYLRYERHSNGLATVDELPPEVEKAMSEQFSEASSLLSEAKKEGTEDPRWYDLTIIIGARSGWSSADLDMVAQESMKWDPEYVQGARLRCSALRSGSTGERGAWEGYAEKVSDENPLGDVLYAILVINMYGYYNDVFSSTNISWERTKRGLSGLMDKYPESVYYPNYAAYLGTIARDREFALANFEKLGDRYLEDVWKKPERFVHFRTWARTGEW